MTRDATYQAPGAVRRSLPVGRVGGGGECRRNHGRGGWRGVYRTAALCRSPLPDPLVQTAETGDVYFPEIEPGEWVESFCQEHPADEQHPYAFSWQIVDRYRPAGDPHPMWGRLISLAGSVHKHSMSYIQWLRREIGHHKTILVYSTVVLQDDNGLILLQQRSDFDWWGLPGGILERGEDILTCARRELHEETGLVAGTLRLVGIYTDPRYDVAYPNGDETQQFSICLAGQAAGGTAKPDGDEILDLAFVSADALGNYDIPAWYRAMIADALQATTPAYEWHGETSAALPARPPDLWQDAGFILPAAMAVVARGDGRIFVPANGAGERRLPVVSMRLGETVAATAVRGAAEHGLATAVPQRLLGVVSAPSDLRPAGTDVGQVVAAVFLLAADDGAETWTDEAGWLLPRQLIDAARGAPDVYGQIARVLHGGAFVDDEVDRHV